MQNFYSFNQTFGKRDRWRKIEGKKDRQQRETKNYIIIQFITIIEEHITSFISWMLLIDASESQLITP